MLLSPKKWFLRNCDGLISMPGQRPYKLYRGASCPCFAGQTFTGNVHVHRWTRILLCVRSCLFYSLNCITSQLLPGTTHSLYSCLTGPSTVRRKDHLLLQNDSPLLWSSVAPLQQGQVVAIFSSTCREPEVLGSPQLLCLQFLQSFSRKEISECNPAPLQGSELP